LGTLKGRVGWLANEAAHGERMQAKRAAWAIASKLNREADARDAAMDGYKQAVAQQHIRDAVAVPGLSKSALAMLDQVQAAVRSVGEQRADEGSDLHAQRIERAVAGVWKEGRANPGIAGELDRFIAAAEQRLGREGMTAAYAAFTKGALHDCARRGQGGPGPARRAGALSDSRLAGAYAQRRLAGQA